MKNPQVALKDRIIVRLVTQPESLDMTEFSRRSALFVTTFCLAGLILLESGVRLAYNAKGVAVGLEADEPQPAARWLAYEASLSEDSYVLPASVVMAARARELWAADYGDAAAEILPLYARDWELESFQSARVLPEQLIELLQVVNSAATLDVAA